MLLKLCNMFASCYIGCFSDKTSSWMSVDTALFVVSAGETKEDSTLVCFTESKDKEVCLRMLMKIVV